jgi:hypothetical protein
VGDHTIIFIGIAEAGVVLASAIRLSNGRWGGPIMRIGESLSSYLPFGIGTMLVLLVAGIWTYLPWTHHVLARQAPFLNVPFLFIRTLGGLALFTWLANKLVNNCEARPPPSARTEPALRECTARRWASGTATRPRRRRIRTRSRTCRRRSCSRSWCSSR